MPYWSRRGENEYVVRIEGLDSSVVENHIYELLSVIGNIINVEIQSDGTKSYALAKFGSDECAEAAIRYFHGLVLKGSTLQLSRKTSVAPGCLVLVWATTDKKGDSSSDGYEPIGMSESQLKGLFSSFGSVSSCEILSAGTRAEIVFRDGEAARLAVDSMNGCLLGVLQGEGVDRGGRLWVEFESRTRERRAPLMLTDEQVEAALQSAEFYNPDQHQRDSLRRRYPYGRYASDRRRSRSRSPNRQRSPPYCPDSPQYSPSSPSLPRPDSLPWDNPFRARSPGSPGSPGGMTGSKRESYSGRRYDDGYYGGGLPRKRRRRK